MNLMQLLTFILLVALVIWTVETFIAMPLRQRKAAARLATGAGTPPGDALQELLEEPPLSKLMANIVMAALAGQLVIVLMLRQDIDIALWLVLATIVTGIFWGVYELVIRRFRVAVVKAVGGQEALAEGQEISQPALVEYSASFFPVLAVVLVLRSFLYEPFTIPSGSMLPTLHVGDYILVNKYAYGLRLPVLGTEIVPVGKPERGDVMVFKYPENPKQNFIKRVVAVPGDVVRIEGGKVFVNGQALSRAAVEFPGAESWERYHRETSGKVEHLVRQEEGREGSSPQGEWQVPADSYFMLGDNRDNSRDSRYWGFVPDHFIVGKASMIWMHKEPGLHLPSFGRNGKVQ
ncbi:MAG: signal peptidase [Moraxellaceae bacterium]|jgi:signal peptidase I|nr:signal peptidase [Moraxellaceae bacterium]